MKVSRRAFIALIAAGMLAASCDGSDGGGLNAPDDSSELSSSALSALAAAIIPEIKVESTHLVETIIDKSLDSEAKLVVQRGLAALDGACLSHFDRKFADLENAQKTAIVAELDAETFRPYQSTPDVQSVRFFFETLKSTVIVAHFTNKSTVEGAVVHDPIPGRYQSLEMPIADQQASLFDRGGAYLLPAFRWR